MFKIILVLIVAFIVVDVVILPRHKKRTVIINDLAILIFLDLIFLLIIINLGSLIFLIVFIILLIINSVILFFARFLFLYKVDIANTIPILEEALITVKLKFDIDNKNFDKKIKYKIFNNNANITLNKFYNGCLLTFFSKKSKKLALAKNIFKKLI